MFEKARSWIILRPAIISMRPDCAHWPGSQEGATTRARIIKALGILQNKRDTNPMKKHGNIPL